MFTKLVRLGKDSELKATSTGKQLLIVTAVYDVGYGDNKKPQWIEAVLWGDRGAKMAQYFTKGTQLVLTLDDVESEGYQSQRAENGVGSKLKAKIVSFDFAGKPQHSQQQTAPQPAPQQAPQPPAGFDDFNDDIPF